MNETKKSSLSTLRRKPEQEQPKTMNMSPVPKQEEPKQVPIILKPQPQESADIQRPAANDGSVDAITELNDTAEEGNNIQTGQLSELQNIANKADEINNRLRTLSDNLKAKYEPEAAEGVTPEKTSSEAIGDRLKGQQPQTEAKLPELIPQEPKPSDDLLDKGPQEVKGGPGFDVKSLMGGPIGIMTNVMKIGFSKVVGVQEKIGGLINKFGLGQIAEAAKTAAFVLMLVIAIDVLRIAWEKWGDAIVKKLQEWGEKIAEWWEGLKEWGSSFADMKFALEGMTDNMMSIKNAWESGDWPSLAIAIGKLFAEAIMTLSGILDRVITKLLSTLLDKLGFKDAAKSVEASGLESYQAKTNAKLDEENQKKVAEAQYEREQNSTKFFDPSKLSFNPLRPVEMGKNFVSAFNTTKSEPTKDQKAREGLSKEDQVKVIAATNEARKAVARYEDVAKAADVNNPAQLEKLNKYKAEAQQYVNNPELAKAPSIKNELQTKLGSIVTKKAASVQPEKSAESKDAQATQAIKAASTKDSKSGTGTTNTANVQNNVVKNSKSYNVQAPVTSTTAPGIFGGSKVN